MRWNVVIGGQLLSKTLRGFAEYKMPLIGPESLAVAVAILALPFVLVAIFVKILPPWINGGEG